MAGVDDLVPLVCISNDFAVQYLIMHEVQFDDDDDAVLVVVVVVLNVRLFEMINISFRTQNFHPSSTSRDMAREVVVVVVVDTSISFQNKM